MATTIMGTDTKRVIIEALKTKKKALFMPYRATSNHTFPDRRGRLISQSNAQVEVSATQ